ncbi:tetratricopeptide repeat protein [Treponema brennaborense]|uniref:RelA/SpoT domain protein n=1 Tax=Treponema brennaborense (strain DSM 12168 / CIP 105900 / DD5/3) TaxID=906968 RepID=F4LIM8_TREBD|nr:tetratricopeptide repeat protein [Treponema brennaborense]AEE17253.1 RelA/SpoT domain protein [Treponema brennaborense DSM 12168]
MQILPNRSALENLYKSYRPTLESVLDSIELQLKDSISLSSCPTFKSRVKDFNSYYRKLLRIKPASLGGGGLPVLTDLMGIRVICAFLEDLSLVEQQIVQMFDVREIERKGADLTFKEFGYESVHVLIALPDEITDAAASGGFPLPDECVCEIQIRTILQDAWAEVEHELVYKSEFSPFDLPLKRKLASMNASLSLADIIFQEIRDYQNKLNREIDCRRNSFYEKADKITRETAPDYESPVQASAPPPSPYVRGTIDDLLLEAIHAHNTGDLDTAVLIYTRIIESKPEPNRIILSVIYKHRGMAYFAQSKYDEALRDFTESVACQPENFRSLYYMGIVYGILGEHKKAVDFFTQSLTFNEFQSHVYYRRALAKYELADYAGAMADLDTANKLGLDDEDCRRLHAKLVEKFDMNM